MPEGSVTIEFGDGTTTTLTPATARPADVRYDARPFRAPFGSAWFAAGDGLRGPERVTVSFEAHDPDGIVSATTVLETAVANLAAAVLLTTPWGVFMCRGVESVSRTPLGLGYRADVVLLTDGRLANDDDVLRLIDGRIWELR